jgi:hypothetical protein
MSFPTNLTELRKAELRLKTWEERQEHLNRMVGSLAVLVDETTWNKALNTAYGYIKGIDDMYVEKDFAWRILTHAYELGLEDLALALAGTQAPNGADTPSTAHVRPALPTTQTVDAPFLDWINAWDEKEEL